MGALYENIVSLCEERNIKPGKMCNEIGISRSILTDLKTGRKKSINAITAQRIADYFGVPVGQVLNGPETEQKKSPLPKTGRGLMLFLAYQVFIRFVQTCTCKTGSQTAKQYFRRQRPCV